MDKLKMRSVVFRDGEFEEYLYLEDALEAVDAGVNAELRALLDEKCVAVIAIVGEQEMPTTGEAARAVKDIPQNHKRTLGISSMAFFQTIESRDPVLALDSVEQIFMVVMPIETLKRFISQRFGRDMEFPKPNHPDLRWVASVARDGQLLCTKQALSVRPDIGQA